MKFKRLRFVLLLLLIGLIIIIFMFYSNNIEKVNIAEEDKIMATDDNIPIGQLDNDFFYEESSATSESIEADDEFEKTEQSQQFPEIEPHIDETTGVKYVTYEDFGAKAQEGYDDYNIIKETHSFANENRV